MTKNADGTVEVRVVLHVQVDPAAWARTMMDTDPDELLQKEIRRDIKKRVRDEIADWALDPSDYDEEVNVPIGTVTVQGVFDQARREAK